MINLVEKTCPVCGKVFEGKTNQVYCSTTCKEVNRTERYRKKRADYYQKNKERLKAYSRLHSNKPVETLERVCPVCGKHFTTTNKNKVYCSYECRRESEKMHAKKNPPEHKKICAICGDEFVANNARRIYCSDECLRKAGVNRERELAKDPEFRRIHSERTIKYQQKVKELGMTVKEFKRFQESGADVEAYLEERRKKHTRTCCNCGEEFVSYNKTHIEYYCPDCKKDIKNQ